MSERVHWEELVHSEGSETWGARLLFEKSMFRFHILEMLLNANGHMRPNLTIHHFASFGPEIHCLVGTNSHLIEIESKVRQKKKKTLVNISFIKVTHFLLCPVSAVNVEPTVLINRNAADAQTGRYFVSWIHAGTATHPPILRTTV